MKTKFKVIEAHSGTDSKEIAKAKREYRKQVEKGMTPLFENVELHFSDENYKIRCTFIVLEIGGIGSCDIN